MKRYGGSLRALATVTFAVCYCCLAVSACSPDPKSKALPPKYFRLDMALKINNKDYPVSYNWHCEQVVWGGESQFLLPIAANPNSAMWTWSSSAANAFNQRLDAETFFSVYLPDLQWCNQDYRGDKLYDHPAVRIVKTAPRVIGLEAFDLEHDHSSDYRVNILSAVVHRLDEKTRDTELSNEQKNLGGLVNDPHLTYQSVDAQVVPSNEVSWPKKSINDYFRGAHGLVVAPIPTHPINQSIGWEDRRFFEVDQRIPDPDARVEFERRHRFTMILQGDAWQLPAPLDSRFAFVIFTIPYTGTQSTQSCPEARIEYQGTSIRVKQYQQIYDADNQLLITFTNQCIAKLF